jgi:hypothetical protein
MSISLSQLLEESFQIAWEYLERTGELGDAALASRPQRHHRGHDPSGSAQPAGPLQSRHQRLSTSSIVRRNAVRSIGMLVRLKSSPVAIEVAK